MYLTKILLSVVMLIFAVGLYLGKRNIKIGLKTTLTVYFSFFVFYTAYSFILKKNPDWINPWVKFGITNYSFYDF